MTEILDPVDRDVEAFWTHAINRAHLNEIEAVSSQDDLTSLRPPTFAFGSNRKQADSLAALVVARKKRATSGYGPSYEAEGGELPRKGELAIVCDGSGVPQALIMTTRVELVPFNEVGPEVAQAEGEGTFEEWKLEHEAFFRAESEYSGTEFDPEANVVVEYFDVLFTNLD